MRKAPSVGIKSGGDLGVNIDSFGLHIRAENLSLATLAAYVGATKQFHQYLVDQGMPLNLADIRREHVESFIADLLNLWNPLRLITGTEDSSLSSNGRSVRERLRNLPC